MKKIEIIDMLDRNNAKFNFLIKSIEKEENVDFPEGFIDLLNMVKKDYELISLDLNKSK